MSLDTIIEQYREAFRKHGNSPSAVFWPKGRQQLRFSRLTSHFPRDGFSVLDFGCGLAHLHRFLDVRHNNFSYTGVDLVPDFITECRKNHPDASFTLINDFRDVTGEYDYVILSGVFNMLYSPDRSTHLLMVRDTLKHLFGLTRMALSCDFMTDRVDFQGEGAFHMNEPELIDMTQRHLSPRYTIDHSYMPYEFALTVYRDQRIARPDNVYLGIQDADSPH